MTAVPQPGEPLPDAPGPSDRGLFGSLPRMRQDPIGLLMDSARTYGDVVRFRFVNRPVYLIVDPEDIRHVFQENYRNYSKQTRGFQVLRSFLAGGLLTAEGSEWLKQRRIAQPAFHRARIAGFGETMARAADEMLDRWDASGAETLDVTAEMMRLTLRIVGETLLGSDVSSDADRVGRAVAVALRMANDSITRLVEPPRFLPIRRNRQLGEALRTLDEVVYGMIARRRRSGADTGDLLSMLMHARDEETGDGMDDRQLRDEVMTIFLAGHETTAVALGWTWYLLSTHPAAARRLIEEVDTVVGSRRPTSDDLPRLRYTEQVIKESMRLYPPAWIISRSAIGDDVIRGYRIPAGAFVFASPYVTHRRPSLWENPEGFDPERFEPGRTDDPPHFRYFPFGGGPRQCIGNTFAMMELQLVVATVARRCRLDLIPGQRIGVTPSITLRPTRPILMSRHPRTACLGALAPPRAARAALGS